MTLSNIAQLIVSDKDFIGNVEKQIKEILKDGRVDTRDVPEIMLIVTECYNNIKNVKVTYEMLPNILEEIVDYILETYCVIPDDQEKELKDMINMAIKLIMVKPQVKKCCLKLLNICK